MYLYSFMIKIKAHREDKEMMNRRVSRDTTLCQLESRVIRKRTRKVGEAWDRNERHQEDSSMNSGYILRLQSNASFLNPDRTKAVLC